MSGREEGEAAGARSDSPRVVEVTEGTPAGGEPELSAAQTEQAAPADPAPAADAPAAAEGTPTDAPPPATDAEEGTPTAATDVPAADAPAAAEGTPTDAPPPTTDAEETPAEPARAAADEPSPVACAAAAAALLATAAPVLQQPWADGAFALSVVAERLPQGSLVSTHSLRTVSLNDRQGVVERYQYNPDLTQVKLEQIRVVVDIKGVGVKALLSANLTFLEPPKPKEEEKADDKAADAKEDGAKRRAPDGEWLTKPEFAKKYGGLKEWADAPTKVVTTERELKVTKGEGGRIGLTIDMAKPQMPTIGAVAQGGPADEAGLKQGMRILKINGKPIETAADIGPAVRDSGDEFTILVAEEEAVVEEDAEEAAKPERVARRAASAAALAVVALTNADDGSEEIERLIAEGVKEVEAAMELELPFDGDDMGRMIMDQPEGGSECLAHILEHAQSTFICPFCESRMGVRRVESGWYRCNQCKDDSEIDMCGSCLRKKKDLRGPQGPYHPAGHTWSYLDRIVREFPLKVIEGFKVAYREKLMSYPVRRIGRAKVFGKPTRKVVQNLKHKRFVMEWLEEELECDWCGARVGMKFPENGWFKCNTCEPCEKDMCGFCFEQEWDLTKKLGDDEEHNAEHTFSNIIRMMEKKDDVAGVEEREKPIPVHPSEITSTFSPDHFCMRCMAPFDIENPHNPRRHPNPEFPIRGQHGMQECEFALELRTMEGKPPDPEMLKRLQCGICHKTVKYDMPVRTTLTLHTFCGDCLMRHLATSGTDPVDGRPLRIGDFARFHTLNEEINSLWATCLYKDDGCPCVVPLREYRDHCDACEFRRMPCQFRAVGCPYVLPGQYTVQHMQECAYGKISHYIRRNEMQKREMRQEIVSLREAVSRMNEQLSLLVQERDHVYASNVFEEDEDDFAAGVADSDLDLEALHARKRAELDRERQAETPNFTWDEHYKGTHVALTEDMLTARGYKSVQIILANQPMTKPKRGQTDATGVFYWEVRVDEVPSCGPVRVGIARNPPRSSHTKSLDLEKPLGSDELSWGWYSSGTFVHDTEHRLDDKGEPAGNKAPLYHNVKQMRFGKGDYLGFLLDCKAGELFLFKNRVFVGKHQGLAKPIVDPHSKRKSDPIYFPAASPGYIHHSVTLRPNAPMQAKPDLKKGIKRFDRKNG
eukprot:TRINITY_DN39308_c0_g1_i1.p1 TRINITY_DN39308_c0_g1~~TRINITY_DN39308_c0_g1_i1.p1  ORF type:complete len:1163 (+),score=376.91 TRINITY_DN39308_c0_g1_i1:66-3554(+)